MRISSAVLGTALVFAFGTSASAGSKPKTHDGFHFQVSGGLGFYSVDGAAPANQAFSGVTVPTSLLLGGNLLSHLIIGGGIYFDYASSPTYKQGGMEVTGQVSSQMVLGLGVYGDYYLDPKKNGLHIQGFAGWGGLETSFNGNVGGSDPTGLVAAGGVGYDWWLTDEWSGGVMFRLLYAPISLNGTDFPTVEPAVVGTLTWN